MSGSSPAPRSTTLSTLPAPGRQSRLLALSRAMPMSSSLPQMMTPATMLPGGQPHSNVSNANSYGDIFNRPSSQKKANGYLQSKVSLPNANGHVSEVEAASDPAIAPYVPQSKHVSREAFESAGWRAAFSA